MEAPPSTPPAGARTDSPPTAGPLSRSRRRPPISLETPVEELVLADRPVWLLLSIAVVAIAVLLVLIIKVRLHAFFSLIVVADRKSTRLNSSHVAISYAVFCLKKKKEQQHLLHE